jgi:hypothetical protein
MRMSSRYGMVKTLTSTQPETKHRALSLSRRTIEAARGIAYGGLDRCTYICGTTRSRIHTLRPINT